MPALSPLARPSSPQDIAHAPPRNWGVSRRSMPSRAAVMKGEWGGGWGIATRIPDRPEPGGRCGITGPVSIERINPGELGRPSGFSHAVSATGGRLIFLAGQTGYGPDGHIVSGGVVPQFERALGNLLTALRAAGGGPGDLVSLTIYAVDLEAY